MIFLQTVPSYLPDTQVGGALVQVLGLLFILWACWVSVTLVKMMLQVGQLDSRMGPIFDAVRVSLGAVPLSTHSPTHREEDLHDRYTNNPGHMHDDDMTELHDFYARELLDPSVPSSAKVAAALRMGTLEGDQIARLRAGGVHRLVMAGVAVGITCVVGLAAVGVLWLIEDSPIVYLNEPFPTRNPVLAGERLEPVIERCNESGRQIVTTNIRRLRSLDTGAEYLMGYNIGLSNPGCATITGDAVVPPHLPAGRYRAHYNLQFSGRWRTFSVDQTSQEFEVVAAEPAAR